VRERQAPFVAQHPPERLTPFPKVEVAPVPVRLRYVPWMAVAKVEVPAVVFGTEKMDVVAKAAVEEEIWKRSRLFSPPTAATESFANGELVPMPRDPPAVKVEVAVPPK
jgi:hypothetical protein